LIEKGAEKIISRKKEEGMVQQGAEENIFKESVESKQKPS
jgi:hypothetical protein